VADLVWSRLGDVPNYVEPFAGSLAVLLARPTTPRVETVNDADCYLSNFWRALQHDPGAVAQWADWPVNEADLHARHLWLTNRTEFRERMKTDPDYYDAKIAGWWVWGISQWIGDGWCKHPEWTGRGNASRASQGIHAPSRKVPYLGAAGQGVNKRPILGGHGLPGVHRKHPPLSSPGMGAIAPGLEAWFERLAARLRRVRICCGDWARLLGPAPTTCVGLTGVFLDPPYAVEDRDAVYNCDSSELARDVAQWAVENGENPDLRIALCGYEGEHAMPPEWECVAWKTQGGYGNNSPDGRGRANAGRERVWFSPHCLSEPLFRGLESL
jgi:site-specific DNA-adenine methylase